MVVRRINRREERCINRPEALERGQERNSSQEVDIMKKEDVLRNKHILAVDDEQDVLNYIEQELPMCLVDKATDYQTALEYIQSYTYDIVILDIMGVGGFRLLEMCVLKDFPTVMLIAHALTPEALERAMDLGVASFLLKDKMSPLQGFLADFVFEGKGGVWRKLLHELGSVFSRKFGDDWKVKTRLLQDMEVRHEVPEACRMPVQNASLQGMGSALITGVQETAHS
jgi:PleD family two-component response regulator